MVIAKTSNKKAQLNSNAVVRHVVRPDWGAAVFVWEREDKRAYQFADGHVRIFKRGFLHLLQPVGETEGQDREATRQLREAAAATREGQQAEWSARQTGRPMVSFGGQLDRLMMQYPDGLADEEWRSQLRGTGAPRRLKRHRDAAVEEAQRLLGAEVLGRFLEQRKHGEIWSRAVEVMKGTDLIAPGQVRPIKQLGDAEQRPFAEALVDLLHGEDAIERRIDRYVQTVGPSDRSWQLATVLLALVHPTEHVCVRPSSFRTQARWTLPEHRYETAPSGVRYLAWQRLALRVRTLLEGAAQAPRDLLDVHDFIRLTTSNN